MNLSDLFLVFAAAAVVVSISQSGFGRTFKTRGRAQRSSTTQNNAPMTDPKAQLAAISKVNFEKRKLMNPEEYRVFVQVEKTVSEIRAGYRVMAQTSLGEFIKPSKQTDWRTNKDAFASVNSKRIDIIVLDKFGHVALAIEYQGSGHHQNGAFMRDAVKREALRRAGIPMLEVQVDTKPEEVRAKVRSYLTKVAA